MGGWVQHGAMNQTLSATLGAFITTWATFTPCFLWIFLGGPHIEQLRGNERLTTALSAVTAAIVGVVMNLAVWFGFHALFPGNGSLDWFALAISVVAFIGMMRWKWDVVAVVIASGLVGLIYNFMPNGSLRPQFSPSRIPPKRVAMTPIAREVTSWLQPIRASTRSFTASTASPPGRSRMGLPSINS
jgi:chromate transport protein ChrA